MKNKIIQARVSDAEYQLVQTRCAECGMSSSVYFRTLLSGAELRPMANQQEIMRELCGILTVLNQMERTTEIDEIREGVNRICRCLK